MNSNAIIITTLITAMIALPIAALAGIMVGASMAWRISRGKSPVPPIAFPPRTVPITEDDEAESKVIKPKQATL